MTTELTERKKKLRDEFIDARGYWNALWDGLLELDEDFFEAYTNFSSVPWRTGPLEPAMDEPLDRPACFEQNRPVRPIRTRLIQPPDRPPLDAPDTGREEHGQEH